MLQEASRGVYKSTTHRVVKIYGGDGNASSSTETDRMSCPLFVHFKSEAFVSEKYQTAACYLDERLKELGLKNRK